MLKRFMVGHVVGCWMHVATSDLGQMEDKVSGLSVSCCFSVLDDGCVMYRTIQESREGTVVRCRVV